MSSTGLRPLQNTPSTARISQYNNNSLGAVYSSLHGFWASRQAAANATGQNAAAARRDAYSVILFDSSAATYISNDFTSSPDDLLNRIVAHQPQGGTDYTQALNQAQSLMVRHWSNERYAIPVHRHCWPLLTSQRSPVLIFLSDGICSVSDATVRSVCRAAIDRG